MFEVTEQTKTLVESGIEFVKRMGLKVVEMKPRYIELMVPIEGNGNHIGTMYAGALFTLAEIPGGALYMSTFDVTKYYPIVKEMTLKFLRPVMTDATVKVSLTEEEVEAINKEAEANGKAEFTLKGEIFDETGKLVAESNGIYQLRHLPGN